MSARLPIVAIGGILIGILPGVLALVDVGSLLGASFSARLTLWNLPWLWGAALAMFAFLVDVRTTGNRWLAISRFDFALIGLLLVQALLLGWFVSANSAAANLHLERIVAALGVGLMAYYGARTYGARFLTPVFYAVIVGMLLTLLVLLYELYAVPEVRTMGGAFAWQLPGMGPLRVFGAGLEAALALVLGLLARPSSGGARLAKWLSAIALWAFIFWSGARGGVLSIVLAAALLSVIWPKYALRLWAVLLVSAVAGALVSLLIWTPENSSFGFWQMLDRSSKATSDEIGRGRLMRWIGSIDIIKNRPLLGHGLSQYSNLWPHFAEADQHNPAPFPLYFLMYRHLHNVVMDALLALGILGATAFIWLAIKNTFRAIARVKSWQTNVRFPAMFGLLVLMAHSFLTGIYVFPQTLLLLGLFFGICLVPEPAQNKNTIR